MFDDKQPLIPSILYTQGNKNVKRDEEEDLKVPDPAPDVAEAAVAKETTCTNKKKTCGCGSKRSRWSEKGMTGG